MKIAIKNKAKGEEIIFSGNFAFGKIYRCPKCNEALIVTENIKSRKLSGYCIRCDTVWDNIESDVESGELVEIES